MALDLHSSIAWRSGMTLNDGLGPDNRGRAKTMVFLRKSNAFHSSLSYSLLFKAHIVTDEFETDYKHAACNWTEPQRKSHIS